jgi:hypothetical protein
MRPRSRRRRRNGSGHACRRHEPFWRRCVNDRAAIDAALDSRLANALI